MPYIKKSDGKIVFKEIGLEGSVTCSYKVVATNFGTYRSVLHEHPSGEMTTESIRKIENDFIDSGRIEL